MNIPWWGKILLVLVIIWAFMHPAQAGNALNSAITGIFAFLRNIG